VVSLANRIRQLRKQHSKMSQEELAGLVGVERSYIGHIETGRAKTPSQEVIRSLATALGASEAELLKLAGYPVGPVLPPLEYTSEDLLRQLEVRVRNAPLQVPKTLQPASAGYGIIADAETVPYMPEPSERNHKFIAVEVRGDCMEPDLHDGEAVIVDTDASPQPGRIVLAAHDGEAIIKRLEQRNGDLYLVARRKRPAIKVTEETRILGVVKGAYRSF